MQREYYIYRHIRLDKDQVFYVGMGVKEPNYKGPGREYHRAFQNGRQRSGWWNKIANKTSYEVEIVVEGLTHEEAVCKEKEFIALYGRKGIGTLCNLTDGGEGSVGYNPSKETRAKLAYLSSQRRHTPETRAKMRVVALTINKNTTGRKVQDIHTGIVYLSLLQACVALGLNPNSEVYRLKKGISKHLKRLE